MALIAERQEAPVAAKIAAVPKGTWAGNWLRIANEHLTGIRRALWPLVAFAVVALVVLQISRLGLAWYFADHLRDQNNFRSGMAMILAMGVRFDLVIIAYICILPLLVTILAPGIVLRSRAWQVVLATWLCLWLMLLVFNEAATPAFMTEFGVRPNQIYVQYLNTPGLVFQTIWGGNRMSLLVGLALTGLAGFWGGRLLSHACRQIISPSLAARLLVLLPLLVVVGYAARGSLGHRPLSVSNAALTNDQTVNDLALNSTYSAAYSIRQLLHEQGSLRGYGNMDTSEVLKRVRAGMQLPASAFTNPKLPMDHVLVPTAQFASRPNLVILLQESLGAHYFASLGGEPVAQELEKWRDRSFWFDNLYASGTRSARGIEAVVTGFLPTRTSSVIKLDGAQQDFYTLARTLKAQGYRTEFIYGGDASFDNMKRFFLNNGFDRVIDQSDMQATAHFTTTWGVSDEDLYARVDQVLNEHVKDGRPFFTLVFSTSNHPPYDFPDGRISLYEQPKQTMRNAARYADHAAARFLDKAASSSYWPSTVFTLVADHESRTIGNQLVPIFSFHIPGFITGGPVEPRIVKRLASQIDLLPTALSLMGIETTLPAPGIDQSRHDLKGPGLAIMQFNDNQAYRVGDRVAMLAPHQPIRQFTVSGNELVPAPADGEFARDALAYSLLPILAYRDDWYR
ncbi:MAG: LTA synthase family protein [Gammaproteobacteria bacterium]